MTEPQFDYTKSEEVAEAMKAKLAAETNRLQVEIAQIKEETEKESLENQIARMLLKEKQSEHDNYFHANHQHRILDFIQHVTSATAESAMDKLARWVRASHDPITVRFSSPGGAVIDGFALYDFILGVRAQGVHVTTVTLGMAASMASVLLQAGDKRIVGPNAHVLIHEVSAGAIGNVSELEDEAAFCRKLNNRLVDILAERATISRATIEKNSRRKDWWLDSQEVLGKGFADEVGYGPLQ
jgi:ATP-dependent Clp endopeptidase proteolytic subunit ClpP